MHPGNAFNSGDLVNYLEIALQAMRREQGSPNKLLAASLDLSDEEMDRLLAELEAFMEADDPVPKLPVPTPARISYKCGNCGKTVTRSVNDAIPTPGKCSYRPEHSAHTIAHQWGEPKPIA